MPESVRRAIEVLALFSEERSHVGPTEVAEELGMAKSTAHAALVELAAGGLLERLPCGRYALGWRTVELARSRLAQREIQAGFRASRALAARLGETVHLGVRERGNVLYLRTSRPPDGVAAPSAPVALDATPLGLVLAADDAAGPAAVVGPQRRLPGVRCAAAPISPDRSRAAAAALAVCAPEQRFDEDLHARAVAAAARRATHGVRQGRTRLGATATPT